MGSFDGQCHGRNEEDFVLYPDKHLDPSEVQKTCEI
ncbi:hypothetical protein POX_g08668 [Penicillium oxalicum]|uniref:Uncharacterized protein n=1 Tax=Penicillium oxalicum (strain 114-2 / CGMCC 5302) TaxID=933388 RepID=S8AMC9_PENO1|nr:hypothetical protein POX_g08668 [Penicillium oxalicum]EPS27033.1 hypothetical protein PDE_01974 [Penicillium oxalicum 114-2]KAI2786285.1 hypothetical protein POX_g08668 [Penicillium oxalicum]